MYAQADLRLCWSHIPHCWKSHATAHIYILVKYMSIWILACTFYTEVYKHKSTANMANIGHDADGQNWFRLMDLMCVISFDKFTWPPLDTKTQHCAVSIPFNLFKIHAKYNWYQMYHRDYSYIHTLQKFRLLQVALHVFFVDCWVFFSNLTFSKYLSGKALVSNNLNLDQVRSWRIVWPSLGQNNGYLQTTKAAL